MPTDIQIVKPDLIIEGNNIATPKRAALNFINATVTDDAINNQTNVTIPPSGITIGTTPITSGVAGRVLFEGAGNVVGQNTDFSYLDNCLNLSQYPGGTTRQLYLAGDRSFGMDVTWAGASTTAIRVVNSGSGANTGIPLNCYNGTTNNAIYATNGNISVQNGNIHIGSHTNAARLDVRAQGALSTDIAFRVRNSADTFDILKVQGDAGIVHNGRFGLNTATNAGIDLYLTAGSGTSYGIYSVGAYGYAAIASSPNTTSTRHNFYAPSCGFGGAYKVENTGGNATVTGVRIGFSATDFNNSAYNNVAFSADIANSGGGEALAFDCVNGNFKFGTGTGTKIGTATGQKFAFWNKTPIVQPTTAITASTLISNLGAPLTDTDTFDGYTLKQVVKALKNLGILA